jgi:hypothetical protein
MAAKKAGQHEGSSAMYLRANLGSLVNRRNLVLALGLISTLAVSACGDNGGPIGSPDVNLFFLDPALAGTWDGTSTMNLSGQAPLLYAGKLSISLNGLGANVSPICPDGTGIVIMSGIGNSARWSGFLRCAPKAFGACAAVSVAFTSANLALSGDGLTLLAEGTATGCETTASVTFTFAGTKP